MSISVYIAQNSEPKVDISTTFWYFEDHMIGALFTNNVTPVCECYSILSVDTHFWLQATTYIDDNSRNCKTDLL